VRRTLAIQSRKRKRKTTKTKTTMRARDKHNFPVSVSHSSQAEARSGGSHMAPGTRRRECKYRKGKKRGRDARTSIVNNCRGKRLLNAEWRRSFCNFDAQKGTLYHPSAHRKGGSSSLARYEDVRWKFQPKSENRSEEASARVRRASFSVTERASEERQEGPSSFSHTRTHTRRILWRALGREGREERRKTPPNEPVSLSLPASSSILR